ncbi:hypothetical protein R1sor_004984 [Riccia sorocarpa]|uniref:DUF7869 domain-containing protein n=1 Tax=Riccia sorocarpa TaxID=122646 RepID=A0ABD3HIT2_9MARC
MRHQAAIEEGKHIIDQKLICKKAFWTIYGFSRTKYYDMIQQADKGIVLGFHGNKGRRKPRTNSSDAQAMLGQILGQLAEPMPNMQHNFPDGGTGIVHMLPSCYSKGSIMRELNSKMASIRNVSISKTLFYALWSSNFDNYKFHKRGAFAKCEICVTLKQKLMQERRPDYRRPIEEQRNNHMSQQISRKNVYYAKRTIAKAQPDKYLCLIHDKMDQANTNIPRLADNMKKLHMGGCLPLLVSLTGKPLDASPTSQAWRRVAKPMAFTSLASCLASSSPPKFYNSIIFLTLNAGMLPHGRDPGAYCHLSLTGLWLGDPNFTITLLAKCLRDLEQVPDDDDHTGDLSKTTSTTSLFASLLDQTAFKATMGNEGAVDSNYFRYIQSRQTPAVRETETTFKKLPPMFMLEMDKSAKDNKNQHVIAFCSELVIRGVFEIVEETAVTTVISGDLVDDDLERELNEENDVQLQHYVGDPSERPKQAFVPLEDISEGKFVILRPNDDFVAQVLRVIWLGRAMGSVVRDTNDEHHGKFLVEWWRPRHRKSMNATDKERYSEILVGQKDWEKDPGYVRPQ